MGRFILIRIIGVTGVGLIIGGYYLLWGSPGAELNEIIKRVKIAVLMVLFGNIMVIFYLFKRAG